MKHADYLLLGSIFAALILWAFLAPPISQHGEAREGLVVQDIVHDHEWILPDPNEGMPFKPPLFHWIAALLAFLLGLSDFTVRLPSAIAAEVMMVATFLMGRAIGGRKTAWLAVGALLGMYEFWVAGTEARVDMVLAACVTVSIAGFFFWYRNAQKAAQVTCYIAAACAVLAKGPIGIVLPGLVIIGFLAAERRLALVWKFWSWPLVGLALLIDVGWYALAYRIGGNEFIRLQLVYENIDHFFNTASFSTRNTNLTLLGWIATRTLPWNLALPWALIQRMRGEHQDSAGRFLHVWWIAICGLFALAVGKRAVYLLPIHPAIALLAARAIAETLRRSTLSAKRVGGAIALLDVAILTLNPMLWTHMKSNKKVTALVETIRAGAPKTAPLFVTADAANTEMMTITYRLDRSVLRKSIACGERGEFFLVPAKNVESLPAETRLVASSQRNKMALVELLAASKADCPAEQAGPTSSDSGADD